MIYYVDMDETLLHTTKYPPKLVPSMRDKYPSYFLKKKEEEIAYWGENAFQMEGGITACRRPYAESFLKTLKNKGKVIVFSAGQIDYVKEAFKVTGLINFIDGYFSSREYNEDLPREKNWVLIDDRPQESVATTIKIRQITSKVSYFPLIKKHNYIQVASFTGNARDTGLKDALSELS